MPAPLNPILALLSMLTYSKGLGENEDAEIAAQKKQIMQDRISEILRQSESRDVIKTLAPPGTIRPLI